MDSKLPSKCIKYSSATKPADNCFDLIFPGDRKIRDCCQGCALPAQSEWKIQVFSFLARLELALLPGRRTILSWFYVQLTRAAHMPYYGSDLFIPSLP